MTTTAPTTTAQHLQLIAHHWQDLHALRTTKPHDAWPPPSLNQYLRALEEYDPADANAPVRLHIVDTITAVQAALVELADQIAAHIQRPAYTVRRSAGPLDQLGQQMRLACAADQADARRWHFRDEPKRTGRQAAQWLLARWCDEPGPCEALDGGQRARIATVAAGAAERVEHALGLARRTHQLAEPCHHCRGTLELHGGDGQPPAVICQGCGRTWQEAEAADTAA